MHTETKISERLWTKDFILIILYNLLMGTANYMLMTGIPLYALELGGNKSTAGLMMGTFMVLAILFRPFFGKLLDDKSRRMVLIIGSIISTLMAASYIFAFSVGVLIILRSLNGIGFSATTNASGTVVSDVIPKSKLAEGVGYYGISNTIATAVGPALSLAIVRSFSYEALFLTVFAIFTVSIIFSFLIDYEKKKANSIKISKKKDRSVADESSAKRKITDLIYEKTALSTGLVIIFVAATIGGTMTFIPTYAATRGIEDIGVYFTVYAVALLFTRLFAGKIADKYGESTVILPGMIIMIAAFVVLAFATSVNGFIISAVLYGLSYGSVQPTLNAVMIRLCPVERRGAGNSTFFIAMDIGSGGGAVLWGIISEKAGFTWVYLAISISVIIALFAYIFVLKIQLKSKEGIERLLA